MCGIFGIVATEPARFGGRSMIEGLVRDLFVLSESRGKEASGLALVTGDRIQVLKRPTPATRLIKSREYRDLLGTALSGGSGVALVGHSRLVTNGAQSRHDNNQPVIAEHMVAVHNGIVANADDIWDRFPDLDRHHDVDTEVLLALLRHFRSGDAPLGVALRRSYEELEGVANIAVLIEDTDELILATNNGSLYTVHTSSGDLTVFASEEYILRQIVKGLSRKVEFVGEVDRVAPGTGLLVNLTSGAHQEFSLREDSVTREHKLNGASRRIDDLMPTETAEPAYPIAAAMPVERDFAGAGDSYKERALHGAPSWLVDTYERNAERISQLTRCTRCVLPSTYPFIEFDADGVCNYCRHYQPITFRGHDDLDKIVAPHRRGGGKPDCLVALSGGRDSCNALHYITGELGMNPIAYTYDWGMVTDLARRNSSRICAGLGIEHIIISANIDRKRSFIRKNVEAWLDKPDIGTVPLFMAGDKQFFWYAEQLKRRTGLELMIFAMNPMERTDFKHGFCGISGGGHDGLFFRLGWTKNLQIAAYYARAYATNRGYINASLFDTVFAYFAYFIMPHKYTMFHDYIPWKEDEVEAVLAQYNWERSPDAKTTWRIGDGTAPFYNYIYYTVAGFTENDTFRSEQIRAGHMQRDEALANVLEDNHPRWRSLEWYCKTIGVDVERALGAIHDIPQLYA